MRFSDSQVTQLRKLLKENLNLECSDVEAQEIGKSIVRFVAVKLRRQEELETKQGDGNGKQGRAEQRS